MAAAHDMSLKAHDKAAAATYGLTGKTVAQAFALTPSTEFPTIRFVAKNITVEGSAAAAAVTTTITATAATTQDTAEAGERPPSPPPPLATKHTAASFSAFTHTHLAPRRLDLIAALLLPLGVPLDVVMLVVAYGSEWLLATGMK